MTATKNTVATSSGNSTTNINTNTTHSGHRSQPRQEESVQSPFLRQNTVLSLLYLPLANHSGPSSGMARPSLNTDAPVRSSLHGKRYTRNIRRHHHSCRVRGRIATMRVGVRPVWGRIPVAVATSTRWRRKVPNPLHGASNNTRSNKPAANAAFTVRDNQRDAGVFRRSRFRQSAAV